MTVQTFFKRLGPVAALAGAALVAGCDGMDIQFGDTEGVPLAELDMTGTAPTELVLAGSDEVIVTLGDRFDIDVSGDDAAVDALRFALSDDSLAVHREKDSWSDKGKATVRVTLPGLTTLVLAGSGDIRADRMDGRADVTVAGSGSVAIDEVDAERFEVTIAGSGDLEASGRAERLELTIAGSGGARLGGVQVNQADVSVVGSGDAEISSDGKVDASIAGSGDITVNGSADCEVSSMGSGSLNCRNAAPRRQRSASETREASSAPLPLEAPEGPRPPESPEAPDA
jgi:hypothetical protein